MVWLLKVAFFSTILSQRQQYGSTFIEQPYDGTTNQPCAETARALIVCCVQETWRATPALLQQDTTRGRRLNLILILKLNPLNQTQLMMETQRGLHLKPRVRKHMIIVIINKTMEMESGLPTCPPQLFLYNVHNYANSKSMHFSTLWESIMCQIQVDKQVFHSILIVSSVHPSISSPLSLTHYSASKPENGHTINFAQPNQQARMYNCYKMPDQRLQPIRPNTD